jgi:hypothetical protein
MDIDREMNLSSSALQELSHHHVVDVTFDGRGIRAQHRHEDALSLLAQVFLMILCSSYLCPISKENRQQPGSLRPKTVPAEADNLSIAL